VSIAERQRSERTLAEGGSRFGVVADSAPVLMWMSGVDTLCSFFDKPWLEFTGRMEAQEHGTGWVEGVHPDDRAECLKAYAEAFDARQPFTVQYRLRRRDGEYRWMLDSGVPLYDADRIFVGYIGSCTDITERTRAENKFRQVFEAAPNAMIMVTADGRIALANAQAEKIFGYGRDELAGMPVETLVPKRFRGRHAGFREEFAEDPMPRPIGGGRELFGRRKDGSEVAVEVGLNPIDTMEGRLVVASVIDVTERRRVEAETQNLRQILAHLSRVTTMGEMTAAIVHELGQPLAAMRANAQSGLRAVASGNFEVTDIRELLMDIVADSRRADQIIQHLRSLFRNSEVERKPLVINDVVNDVVSVALSEGRRRGVSIDLDMAPRLPLVFGDRVQLQQVLLNLIVNAFEAMAEVTDRQRHVTLRTRPLGDKRVRVEVADNGPGIAPEKLPSIFKPFATTKASGLGMGLAVGQSIVRAHHGQLWAENRRGGGAVFNVVLPANPDECER
jgi:two-component system sensor kinase FixL